MKSRRRTILIAALFLSLQSLAGAGVRGQQPSAASAVNSFYRFHLSHNMDFRARNIQLRRRWLTPEFYQLLLNEIKRQALYSKAHPDEIPDYDGDPFTDSQEFPDSFRVGKQVMDGERAKVTVTLLWSTRTSRGRDKRDIVVEAMQGPSGWLINDIINSEGSTLRDEFKKAH
jgi:Protein of unknown function (DUF3828)